MRGLAVIIMIQCHAFNSFTRMDLRQSGGYMLSQFVGGMAAPLFLFMAGMTSAFQMESLERRESGRVRLHIGQRARAARPPGARRDAQPRRALIHPEPKGGCLGQRLMRDRAP